MDISPDHMAIIITISCLIFKRGPPEKYELVRSCGAVVETYPCAVLPNSMSSTSMHAMAKHGQKADAEGSSELNHFEGRQISRASKKQKGQAISA
jgi:hypothetical protein